MQCADIDIARCFAREAEPESQPCALIGDLCRP